MKDNYDCICYHDRKSHTQDVYKKQIDVKQGQCLACWVWGFDCMEYKRDNLKYLEQLSMSRDS